MCNQSLHMPVAGMFCFLVLAPWLAAAEPVDHAPPSAPQPAVSIQLSISVQEFDPAKPTGEIRCVVTNRTDRAIEIADRYDGEQVALIGDSHRWPLRFWDRTRNRQEPKMVVVEPGREQVVFEFSLAEILRVQDPKALRQDFDAGRRVMVSKWSYSAT